MRALLADPAAPMAVRLADAPKPEPGPGQVLIEVHHASLNYGDLNDAKSGRVPPGGVLGSDAAGVVRRAAAGGPAAGTRVVALTTGAFAEYAVAAVAAVAVGAVATLVVGAGVWGCCGWCWSEALRAAGAGPGKRVLVTGASGGVGRYAVQLAAQAGAYVIASVGSPARGRDLARYGADQVVVGLDGIEEPVDAVLDNVGGPQLAAAWKLLAPAGSLQSIGWTSGEPAVFPPYATVGPAKSLSSFLIGPGAGADLANLVGLVAGGRLSVDVGWRGPLAQVAEAAEALVGRRVNGKAVLDLR